MPSEETPRFVAHLQAGGAISRRTAIFGGLAAGVVFVTGCGNNDAAVLETPVDTATTPRTDSDVEDPTAVESASGDAATGSDGATATGPAVASMMAVNFTYAMGTEGKQLNPYIAVWIEDAAGTLVETVAVWFQQDKKGDRWLNDLTKWHAEATEAAEDYAAVSSATRTPGSYSVSWNGPAGAGIAAGDYIVNIESARERGPASLVRQPITVTGPESVVCTPDGELTDASIDVLA